MSTPPGQSPPEQAGLAASAPAEITRAGARRLGGLFEIRHEAPVWQVVVCGAACLAVCYCVWWFLTRGSGEERILSYSVLPSPDEVFSSFPSLWFDRALTRNMLVTLKRVTLGFGLAAAVGIPIGVLCGCFSWINSFFIPLSLFGRNIPLAALVGITFSLFGIGEEQKIMFIFIACVAFIMSDTAGSIREVGNQYVDTAYTLGASRLQVILKVLIPLALPGVFNSLRLLFGLAFGYIMLAETIKLGAESGGLGDIINTSMRRGPREHVFLVLLIIPLVALALDRILFWIQRELFPHRFGGMGILNQAVRAVFHVWEDLKGLVFRRSVPAIENAVPGGAAATASPPPKGDGK
ncbi:MAG: ABC transporter permease subunit [Planctomycetia bacterium]|nr:ABC transporter permease subunit [Planctomycetia bacterium]